MKNKKEQHWAELFQDEFDKESDRARIILAAAMLDSALETLLRARLVPTSSHEDSLLDGPYSPISSFSARIDLAHRIGLISIKFCRDLHIVRRIRNEFAHNVIGCSFNSPSVRSRIIELRQSMIIVEKEPEIRKKFPEGYRGDFQMMITFMLYYLYHLVEEITFLEPGKEEMAYQRMSK